MFLNGVPLKSRRYVSEGTFQKRSCRQKRGS